MTVGEIYNYLNEIAPFNTAFEYDNPGLLVGDKSAKVTGITLSLDCYNQTIKEAIENGSNLIITHHPIIFDPLKSVLEGSIVHSLIKNGISLISAHTNLDMAMGGVNDALCERLGLSNVKPHNPVAENAYEFRSGELAEAMDADEFAKKLSCDLNVRVKYCGEGQIKTLAVCGGTGGGLMKDVISLGIDALVTADCKHSFFVEADRTGFALFDCGHFNTEDVIIEPLAEKLCSRFPNAKIATSHYNNIKYTK